MEHMDELLRDAFDQMAKEEYNRRTGKVKKHRFSLAFRWKMHQMSRRIGRRQRENGNNTGGSLMELYRPITSRRRLAVLVVLLMMLIGGTVGAAGPVIRWLYDHYMEQHKDHVNVQTQEEAMYDPDAEFQKYEITEIPEGYHLQYEEFDEVFYEYCVRYVNEENHILLLKQTRQEIENLGNFTSDTNSLEEVQVGRFTGYYIADKDTGTLMLSDGVYMVVLSGDFSKEELFELTESLVLQDSP